MSERTSSRRPVIGITMGDPLGIGPEVVLKALADPEVRALARYVIYGMNDIMAYTADRAELDPFWYRVQHDSPRANRMIREEVVVLDFDEHDLMLGAAAQPTRAGGLASKSFVEQAIADAMLPPDAPRRLDAIVTAPVSKQSWHLAGFNWPGHTELLARRTAAKRTAMAFVSPNFRVVLATVHVPLMEIRNLLTIGRVFDPIDLGHAFCQQLGIASPRIAVCGLNPHAGEGGLFGDEEERLIAPAIRVAKSGGIDVSGPFPGDTIFLDARGGKFDLVVAMYHDQGLIPVKLLDRDSAVNVTLGLPIIRTSPDHGTAFNIAGLNRANPGSMISAIRLAVELTQRRADTTSD